MGARVPSKGNPHPRLPGASTECRRAGNERATSLPSSGARAVAARRGVLRRREPVARVDVRHATSIDARSESSAPDGAGGAEAIAQRLPDQLAER